MTFSASFLEKCLVASWFEEFGENAARPKSTKFAPDLVQEFNDQFDGELEASQFIKDSVKVWAQRIRKAVHPPPFFPKMLFTERHLDLLSRYRSAGTQGTYQRTWSSDIQRTENDYLALRWSTGEDRFDLIMPNPYWIIACHSFKRFGRCPFRNEKVMYKGRLTPLHDALRDLTMMLKQSTALRSSFLETARAAFEQARRTFLVKSGLATVFPDREHAMSFQSRYDAKVSIDSDLHKLDNKLFAELDALKKS